MTRAQLMVAVGVMLFVVLLFDLVARLYATESSKMVGTVVRTRAPRAPCGAPPGAVRLTRGRI